MRKPLLIGTIVLFVVWVVMDFIIHGVLLKSSYDATAALWRPWPEIKAGVIWATTFISALCFTLIYLYGFAGVSVQRTLAFGLWFGVAAGVSMGLGSYATMPIPLSLALSWLLGTLIEALVGVLVLHWVYGRFGEAQG
ncbi:MAG TPA: hypothetical protein VKB51_14000 [bacterium]|nr:hypothetical protein [bacterium]